MECETHEMLLGIHVEEVTETEFFDRAQQGRPRQGWECGCWRVRALKVCVTYVVTLDGMMLLLAKGQWDIAASRDHPPVQTSPVYEE